jgi:CarD family transcriptional regulator
LFNVGDSVVHPKHGTGVVTERRTIQYSDHQQSYFCIELTEGRGSVMIPVERVEQVGLREPIRDLTLIRQVLDSTPETLLDDPRIRQAGLEALTSSGSIERVATALRDLCWRETVSHLSPTDKKLKESAISKIVQELALNPLMVITTVRMNIEQIIQETMQAHLALAQRASGVG